MSSFNSFLGGVKAGQAAHQKRQSAFNEAMAYEPSQAVPAIGAGQRRAARAQTPRPQAERSGGAVGRRAPHDSSNVFKGLDTSQREEVQADLTRKSQIVAALSALPVDEQAIGIQTYGKDFGIDAATLQQAAADPGKALATFSSSLQEAEAMLEQSRPDNRSDVDQNMRQASERRYGAATAESLLGQVADGQGLTAHHQEDPSFAPETLERKSEATGLFPQDNNFIPDLAGNEHADRVPLLGEDSALDGFRNAYGDPYLSKNEAQDPALLASKGRGIPRSILERLDRSGRVRTTAQHRRIEQFELYRSQIQRNDPLNPIGKQISFDINYVPTTHQVRTMQREALQAKHFRAQYNQIESYMEHSQGRPNNFTTSLVATEAELYRLGREFVGFGSTQKVIPFSKGRGFKNEVTGREFRFDIKLRKLDNNYINYQANFIQNVPRAKGNSTKKTPQINVHVNAIAPRTSTELINSRKAK
ncbi:MAG: hypothetical protein ABJN69_13040 [Hellea sp.]